MNANAKAQVAFRKRLAKSGGRRVHVYVGADATKVLQAFNARGQSTVDTVDAALVKLGKSEKIL